MAELKAEFMKLEPGQTYKVIPMDIPEEYHYRYLHRSYTADNAIPCPHCENEKIESRFEILDL